MSPPEPQECWAELHADPDDALDLAQLDTKDRCHALRRHPDRIHRCGRADGHDGPHRCFCHASWPRTTGAPPDPGATSGLDDDPFEWDPGAGVGNDAWTWDPKD